MNICNCLLLAKKKIFHWTTEQRMLNASLKDKLYQTQSLLIRIKLKEQSLGDFS